MKLVCQGLKNSFATGTVIGLHFHLDQAMCVERRISFFFYSVCQTVRADHDNDVQVVRFSTLVFTLGRGKLYLSHALIIGDVGLFR